MKINDVLKKTASVLFLLFAAIISNAQSKNDTIYFNDSWLKTIKDSAAYFRIVEQVNDRFKVEDRFLNGKLQMSGIYTSMKPEVKEGLFKYYSKDGEPTVEGYFKANEKDGEWKTYHSKDHVWLIENFSKGKYNGEFRSYFLNGQLKRKDLYKDDKLYKKGRCYTYSGKDTSYYPFEDMPSFKGGEKKMIKFLQKNIRYPEEAKNKNIQGRVMVEFVIDTDGLVDDVKVLQGVHPLLDEAAIELVKAMPPWKPGSQDGKFVRVKFSLPIRFQL